MQIARVAVLFDERYAGRYWLYGLNTFEAYIAEILSHAGIPYDQLDDVNQLERSRFDVVIVAFVEETEHTASLLWRFAEHGGIVISYAGLSHMRKRLGCSEKTQLTYGYASLPANAEPADSKPLRFLQARPWLITGEQAMEVAEVGVLHKDRPDGGQIGAPLLQFKVGSGWIDRWSVNIPYTVVGFQQGTKPVFADGIPAPDRTGDIDEGILKADDGCEMDWELDRLFTETGMPYYAYPYADLWREAAISHLLQRVVGAGLTLPFVDYWPEGIHAVALISHDSDGNEEAQAEKLLELLKECQIHTTWCMLEPGYRDEIYTRVNAEGHELAFHYNALDLDNGFWDEAEFNRQLNGLKESAPITEVCSNKNHYTRFEAWGDLFAWCERAGIACDQTRGPSKKGNVGFLFGTCHPYFPITWGSDQNRLYDVLELGFLTQDLELPYLADSSVVKPFLDQAYRVQGVAHFLFHQQYMGEPKVTAALRNLVTEARKQGFVFWTSKQINDWERARRTVKMDGINDQGEVKLSGDPAAQGAVVWIPVVHMDGSNVQSQSKFGVNCVKQLFGE
ncbi:hypothetical protein [Paenibacillus eucommiae]|uniref:NodB homology domain-containing protein n=1 Tax=Paenibacillus eucommiae TaxID=1355755 RepID=A0ABS4IU42_9BACL|nr:hypothetical protein [Paenibacillus eucommiae]MBP1990541.1 hypothetical protein [Paenibacillus eucommiae]